MKKASPVDTGEFVEKLKAKKIDLLVKTISYFEGRAYLCYIGQLTDRVALSELVIKPLLQYCSEKKRKLSAEVAESLLYADQSSLNDDLSLVEKSILDGRAVLLFTGDAQYVIVDCKRVASRSVPTPELEYAYRGPRDSFVENLDMNLSLLRYRLKDGNIRIEKTEVGARTKSTVALVFLEDIANPDTVEKIRTRIDGIRTDGVYESGELQNYLLNKTTNLFPQMGLVERSDMAVEMLLEGKVVILIDGSCIALNAPRSFPEFFYSCDDRYENKYFGLLMRIIRYTAVSIAITSTSYYIAMAEYHTDAMPASYIVTFAQMRSRAPFSALIAVLTLEFIVELMREALLRVPVKIGSAIAIVGAIIIGGAASASGFYSPLLLILVSLGFLSSFAIPDITLSNPLRILKFMVILLTGCFGFFGFSLAITFIIILVVSNDSFGIPYTAPWAPFNRYDFARTLIFSKRTSPRRQGYMRNKDYTRSPEGHDQNSE
jgi:spore germination protein KA/spore germination protein